LAALFFGSFLLGIKRKGLAEGTKQKERNDTLFNPIAPKALSSKQTASFPAVTITSDILFNITFSKYHP
jgi:hypothetical protein